MDAFWSSLSYTVDAGIPYEQRLYYLVALQLCITIYQRSIALKAPAGVARLLVSVPSLLGLVACPLLFHHTTEVLVRCSLLFTCAWLGAFKVLAACMNRGPLISTGKPLTPIQFHVLLYFPVFPVSQDQAGNSQLKGRLQDKAATPLMLLVNGLMKLVTLGMVLYCLMRIPLPVHLRNFMYALGLVGFLGLLMDAPASVATSFIGLQIIPTFDRPWLSSSLADFWGRRWNVTTSSVLRTLVYDPIIEGSWIKADPSKAGAQAPQTAGSAGNDSGSSAPGRPAKWRRTVGTFAVFFVSGISHEYIINSLVVALPDGTRPWLFKWTAYFTMQAPLLLMESKLKRTWKHLGFKPLNVWVSRALTITFSLLVADALFFAPVDKDSDLAARVVSACVEGYQSAWHRISPVILFIHRQTFLRATGAHTSEL